MRERIQSGAIAHSLYIYGIIIVIVLFFMSQPLFADRRSYVWTYEYLTMPKGMAEIEHYLTLKLPDVAEKDIHSWEQRLEVEFGITDRWDISIYQIFEQKNGGSFKYSAFQLRTRYRLFEAGALLFDPLLYFEYKRYADLKAPNKLEGKIILARDIGALNMAFNFIEGFEFGGRESEFESEYTFGASYEFAPAFKLGMELFGNFKSGDEANHYMGPTISFASGKLWYTVGAGLGITDKSNDFRIRALLGIHL
ncbi:MAG TPA: hypothetical protein ENN22_03255 [bacterium]|nr:hypothetical protein [bacterium]